MRYGRQPVTDDASSDPCCRSSLVPMLIAGLVLTPVGMFVAVILA